MIDDVLVLLQVTAAVPACVSTHARRGEWANILD